MMTSTVFLLKAMLISQTLGWNLLLSAFARQQQKLAILARTRHWYAPRSYPNGLAVIGLAGTLMVTEPGLALPQAGEVQAGTAEIEQVNPEQLNIIQQSERAVINWQGFSVGEQQQVNFQQPSATSATLNRVTGLERSNIAGRVTANGQVMFVNPNGIVFGPAAQIDVAGLMATTLDIRNQDFMNGRYNLQAVPGMPGGTVENLGQITVKDQGFAALVAPGVSNSGVINARLGKVVLAAGTQATLDFSGDGLVSLAVDPALAGQLQGANGQPLSSLVNQSGQVNADGGVVTLSTRAGRAIVNNAINMSGVIQARSVSNQQGEIVLSGSDTGNVSVTGTLDASGTAGQSGGVISLFSDGAIDTTKGSLNSSSESGNGGKVYLSAKDDITTSTINASGRYSKGTITLESATGNIDTTAGSLLGGRVSLDAAINITTGAISSRSDAGDSGNISLQSGSSIDTSRGTLDSGSEHGSGGVIYLAARNTITTGKLNSFGSKDNGTINLYSITGQIYTTGTINGGNVTLDAAGDIKTKDINSSSVAGTGGYISLTSGSSIDISSGTLTARSNTDSVSSGEISLAAKSDIVISYLASGTTSGNAGNLTVFSQEGEIVNSSNLSAVITNGNVKLGIFGAGNLGGEEVGIDLAGVGDAIMPGCLCEGWGVAGNGIAAGVSVANSAPGNLKVTAFSSTASTATSTVELASLPSMQVTQAYLPAAAAPTALFENRITITNKGNATINDIRYTRAMDWDVPPNPFDEYVTIGGREGAKNVLYSSNNGFSTVNPLAAKTYIHYYQKTATGDYVTDANGDAIEMGAETVNTDFVDSGAADHGAVFDLGFGDLASGSSKTFSIYYGATTSEATALEALADVEAEMYSLGQSSLSGSPGTFIFGFKGVGGEPIVVEPPAIVFPEVDDDGDLDIIADDSPSSPAVTDAGGTSDSVGDRTAVTTPDTATSLPADTDAGGTPDSVADSTAVTVPDTSTSLPITDAGSTSDAVGDRTAPDTTTSLPTVSDAGGTSDAVGDRTAVTAPDTTTSLPTVSDAGGTSDAVGDRTAVTVPNTTTSLPADTDAGSTADAIGDRTPVTAPDTTTSLPTVTDAGGTPITIPDTSPSNEATIVASTNPSTLPITNTDVIPAGNDSGDDDIATAAPTSTNDSSDDNFSGELANSNSSLHDIDNGLSVSYLFPTDLLDYLGLGVDAAERLYIELNYKEGEEKDFQRFVNTLYFVIDAVFASTPGAGGGGLAARGSHELAVAGWRATPNSVKLRIEKELAKRMGWPVAKAAQMINVFFSEISGGGGGGNSGNSGSGGEENLQNEPPGGSLKLTPAQAARIETIDEIAHNWQVRKLLSGEMLDAGHIQKIEEGIKGLEKAKTALQNSLKNPNLNQATRNVIQLRIDTANRLINRAKELLAR